MARNTSSHQPPPEVERSISWWLTAVGAGIAETLLQVGQAFAVQPAPGAVVWNAAIRMLIYTGLWALVLRLRTGENWVRGLLALALGLFGTLGMVVPPVVSMFLGYSVLDFLTDSNGWTLLFAVLRIGHIAAVLLAVVAMFQPAANRFFLRRRVSGPTRKRPQRRATASARRRQ